LRNDLRITALLHDVGHPPFSHAVEHVLDALGAGNHNQRTNELIEGELAKLIVDCESTPERILDLLDKKSGDPRGKIVTSKSIGADKLGYLYQDQRVTGHNAAMPGDYTQLMPYLCFVENDLRVAETAQNFLMNMQKAYFEMYTEVYLRKQALAFERILQKAIEKYVEESGVEPFNLWGMSESRLEVELEDSSPIVKRLYERVEVRDALKAAVTFKIDKYARTERVGDKPISVVGCYESELEKFADKYGNPVSLTSLEKLFAKELKIDESDIVVTVLQSPKKLVPEDVSLVTKDGRLAGTLFERSPVHYASLVESARNFYTIRVMVDQKYRERVSKEYKTLVDIVKQDSGVVLG
jgi:HD superfamily phosphohydrolase